MKSPIIIFMLFIAGICKVMAQENDTDWSSPSIDSCVQSKTYFYNAPYSGFVIPAVFVSYGLLAHNQKWMRQPDVKIDREVSRHFTRKIHADDYIQYVSAVAVFGVDLMGAKAKHNLRDRAFLMASSYIISSASTHAIKRISHVRRPDESDILSFPSGHTATAFVGAHLLFKEYKDVSPWIGIAGYAVACGTGAIRIYNRRHWFSDVVAGAGFGMLSVEISYVMLPVFHHLTGVNDDRTSLAIVPVIGVNNFGVGIACTF